MNSIESLHWSFLEKYMTTTVSAVCPLPVIDIIQFLILKWIAFLFWRGKIANERLKKELVIKNKKEDYKREKIKYGHVLDHVMETLGTSSLHVHFTPIFLKTGKERMLPRNFK